MLFRSEGGGQWARCTLHGLSDYVLRLQQQQHKSSSSPSSFDAVADLANGKLLDYNPHDNVGVQWESIAREFIASQKCSEANLYLQNGATLKEILHHQDQSEFKDTCGGAMALFEFP